MSSARRWPTRPHRAHTQAAVSIRHLPTRRSLRGRVPQACPVERLPSEFVQAHDHQQPARVFREDTCWGVGRLKPDERLHFRPSGVGSSAGRSRRKLCRPEAGSAARRRLLPPATNAGERHGGAGEGMTGHDRLKPVLLSAQIEAEASPASGGGPTPVRTLPRSQPAHRSAATSHQWHSAHRRRDRRPRSPRRVRCSH